MGRRKKNAGVDLDWSKEVTLILIGEIKKRKCLWDATHTDYKRKNKKTDALLEIVKLFNDRDLFGVDEEVKLEDIQAKFNSLKSSYRRERDNHLKRVSGSGADDIYTGTWWAYDEIAFMFDHNIPDKTKSNIDSDNDAKPAESKKKKKIDPSEECYQTFMKKATGFMEGVKKEDPNNPDQVFGNFVVEQIGLIDNRLVKQKLKNSIIQMISEKVTESIEIEEEERKKRKKPKKPIYLSSDSEDTSDSEIEAICTKNKSKKRNACNVKSRDQDLEIFRRKYGSKNTFSRKPISPLSSDVEFPENTEKGTSDFLIDLENRFCSSTDTGKQTPVQSPQVPVQGAVQEKNGEVRSQSESAVSGVPTPVPTLSPHSEVKEKENKNEYPSPIISNMPVNPKLPVNPNMPSYDPMPPPTPWLFPQPPGYNPYFNQQMPNQPYRQPYRPYHQPRPPFFPQY